MSFSFVTCCLNNLFAILSATKMHNEARFVSLYVTLTVNVMADLCW